MDPLIKQITCSLSEKIQHESYGGAKYTSTDLFESESEQVPSTLDFEECQLVWSNLRRRVEARIGERKRELIATLQGRPYTPVRVESHPPSSESVKRVLSHSGAFQTPLDGGSGKTGITPGVAKTPFRRVPANSVPAIPKIPVPDTESGAPF